MTDETLYSRECLDGASRKPTDGEPSDGSEPTDGDKPTDWTAYADDESNDDWFGRYFIHFNKTVLCDWIAQSR